MDAAPAPGSTATAEHCHINIDMTRIRIDDKRQSDLQAFYQLHLDGLFTDMVLVSKDKRRMHVHSLVVANTSQVLRPWIEATPVPEMEHTVILPDVDFSDVKAFCQILYGVNISISQRQFQSVHLLADMLGIQMDIQLRDSLLPAVAPAPASEVDQQDAAAVALADSPASRTRRHSKSLTLPLCCWHCNKSYCNLTELDQHIKSHKGEALWNKRHKCQKCKKILPSMWKLRQHLLTHKAAGAADHADRRDHLYAGLSGPAPAKSKGSDHQVYPDHSYVSDHPYSSGAPLPGDDAAPQPEATRDAPAGASASAVRALGHSYAAEKPAAAKERKQFACPKCSKVFPENYRLTRHIREVHVKEKCHRCSVCDKSFFKISSVQRHELIHVEDRRWKCPNAWCLKSFSDRSSLKYHVEHSVCSRKRKR